MFRTLSRRRLPDRRGAILLVVLTLLALFAVIGLSFALYAESEATAARIHREGENKGGDPLPGNSAQDDANLVLGQLLYGSPDGPTPSDPTCTQIQTLLQMQSALRGHSLNRTMYGYDIRAYLGVTTPDVNSGLSPFAGLGLFPPVPLPGSDSITAITGLPAIDRSQVINYAVYIPGASGGTMYCIDPEWNQYRASFADTSTFTNGTRIYRPVNAPYTYPDLKDLYLAALNPTTGTVMQPSFHRTYGAFTTTGGAGLITGLEPTNTNWLAANPQGRLYIVRPRPVDHVYDSGDGRGPVSDFPYPPPNADGSYTGDVQNLPSPQGQQRNDAIWIYPGGPVRRWNGKLYTMLVAPTVIDLNGRVNLSLAGNLKNNNTSASNAGLAPYAINPQWVFDNFAVQRSQLTAPPVTPNTQTASLLNIISGIPGYQGRYGITSAMPPADRFTGQSTAYFNNGLVPPSYSRVDFDGLTTSMTNDRANNAGTLAYTSPFPAYANTRYGDSTTLPNELSNSPAQFNPDFWSSTRNFTTGRTFAPDDLRRLATRYGDDPSKYSQTDLAKLAPWYLASQYYPQSYTSTTDAANLVRMLVTTQSSSITRPEVQVPTGPPTGTPAVTPFARLGPIDLNRPLPPFRVSTGAAPSPANVYQPTVPAQYANYALARRARQNFARDIFVRLAALAGQIDGTFVAYNTATGYLNNPASPGTPLIAGATPPQVPQQQYNNLRSIAQIAANIVDYIDPDDINTTFVWNPLRPQYADPNPAVASMNLIDPSADPTNFAVSTTTNQLGLSVVFGTELPRLVVNEAYAELANNPNDIGQNQATNNFRFKFWVELVNPLGAADPVLSDGGAARLQYQNGVSPNMSPSVATTYPVYQVMIAYPNKGQVSTLLSNSLNTNPLNVTGNPLDTSLTGNFTTPIQNWSYTPTTTASTPASTLTGDGINLVMPVQGANAGAAGSNAGYYVLGPTQNSPQDTFPGYAAGTDLNCSLRLPDQTAMVPTTANSMIYEPGGNKSTDLNDPTMGANLLNRTHTIILRRLANPYLPPNDPNWALNQAMSPDPVATNAGGGGFNSALPVNPYITVDYIENVPTRDRVTVTGDQPMPRTAATPGPGAAGNDTNPSIGKRHVYGAGNGNASNGNASQAHDGTNNVNQPVTQQTAPAAMMPVPTPAHSFFFANNPFGDAGGGLMAAGTLPWMTHYDRQLLNPLELVGVSAVSPALVTQNFVYMQPSVAMGGTPLFTYNRHTAESLFLPGLQFTVPVGAATPTWVWSAGVPSFYTGAAGSPPPYPVVQPSVAQSGAVPNALMAGFLSRGLETLTVRSFLNGVPVGGREQGKLNINTIWHQSVLRALLDSNTSNYFTDSDVTNIWQQLTNVSPTIDPMTGYPTPLPSMSQYPAARSQWGANPQPLSQYNTSLSDAPFWGLSSAAMSANLRADPTFDPALSAPVPNPMGVPAIAAFNNFQRTLLRSPNNGTASPMFYNMSVSDNDPNVMPPNSPPNPQPSDPTHAAFVTEPLRKAWNNTTTTSNAFLVVMTFGYFEVRADPATVGGRVYLGKELFQTVPGDLRKRFVAVVDRSNLAVDPTTLTPQMGYLQAATATTPALPNLTPPSQPWFTTLLDDVQASPSAAVSFRVNTDAGGNVYVGGVPVPLKVGQGVWLGFGNGSANNNDGEYVVITGVTPNPAPSGTSTVTVASTQRYHPAGSPVCNLLLGNPGPQPAFDFNNRRYQGVVPYCVQVPYSPTP